MAHIFGSIWDRFNRNALNNMSKEVDAIGKSIQDLVAKGQLTPKQYAELLQIVNDMARASELNKKADKDELSSFQNQLNNLVLHSGNPSETAAEISQARGAYPVVNDRISKNEVIVGEIKKQLYGDEKGELLKGYFNGIDSILEGVGWYHYYIYAGSKDAFILEYPTEINVRINYFDNGSFLSREYISNGVFILPSNCTEFSINIPLINSIPKSEGTEFIDFNNVEKLIIKTPGNISDEVDEMKELIPKLEDIVLGGSIIYPDMKLGYFRNGYGTLALGTNWYNCKFDISGFKSLTINYKKTAGLRVFFYDSNNNYINNDIYLTNEKINFSTSVKYIGINFPIIGADPDTTGDKLSDLSELENISITLIRTSVNSVLNRLTNLENGDNSKGVLRLLMIGNSFSVDATTYLYDIAKSAGINLIVGVAYDSGGSLQSHWDKLQTDGTITAYNKWMDGYTSQSNALLKDIIDDESWDIITFQQESSDSGKYPTFQEYLTNLHNYVISKHPNARYGFHMTWAYAEGDARIASNGYTNQEGMYNAITNAYAQAMAEMDFDILIPTGTAIQNARTNQYLQSIGNDLTRDGSHLDFYGGRYIASLTIFEAIISNYYGKNISDDVKFIPSNVSKNSAYLSKLSAKNGVLNPFNVTEI